MFDEFDDDENELEDDALSHIPEEAFYYEESAHKYGVKLGYSDAEQGLDDPSTVEDFDYPEDADPEAVEIFKEAYLEGIEKYNNQFDDEEEEWD